MMAMTSFPSRHILLLCLIGSISSGNCFLSAHSFERRLRTARKSNVETLRPYHFQSGFATILGQESVVSSHDESIYSRHIQERVGSILGGGASFLEKSWWSLPLGLAVVPIYSMLVLRTAPSMPTWWPVTPMDYIRASKHAAVVVSVFLGSNLSYFVSGSYLMFRFRDNKSVARETPLLLGGFVILAGAVSTVFHAFQAFGMHRVAEALCYVDHAVAISGILCFLHKCGKPGRTTTILSALGFLTLVATGPGYAWLHSTWHLLSSMAAVNWACEGLEQ